MQASNTHPFATWEAELGSWIDDIKYPRNLLGDFRLEPKYADPPSTTIEFGAFKGRPKWRTLVDVPTQPARDALLNLVTVQGDTEFASVEQQRHLVGSAPTAYDRKSLVRVNAEEMRHGLQMAHILVTHFGGSGAVEARKLLGRRATRGDRLLKAFNDPVRHWLDFFCYTAFMDRDGKYQLTMLQRSAFHPLAASMGPMLKEEAFHLGTGVSGLKRILQAQVIPTPILQKYVNWWISAAYDCFGKEESGAAAWAYEWGLKGRFDESESSAPPERDAINDHNRALYAAEVDGIVTNLNSFRQKGQPPLTTPSIRFHRRVGKHEDQPYSTAGDLLSRADHEAHLMGALPTAADEDKLREWFKEEWIAPRAST